MTGQLLRVLIAQRRLLSRIDRTLARWDEELAQREDRPDTGRFGRFLR